MAVAWVAVVLLCLVMYVLLDGYDLGIGVQTLFERDRARQRELVEIVATAWDGNETWLILLGVSLWGGFPLLYGVMLPHAYLGVIVMLFALIVRGASIEMVSARPENSPRWLLLFGVGSVVAAAAQGMVFGSLTEAVPVAAGRYAGAATDILSPYTAICAAAAVLLYAALGAGYVRLKTSGALRDAVARRGGVMLGFAAAVSTVAALSVNATAAPLVLDSPLRIVLFAVLAVIAAIATVVALVSFPRPASAGWRESLPFAALCCAIVAGLLAFVVARFPALLPPSITVESAVAPVSSQLFLLIGVGANVPLILFYTWFAHHVFRGKYRVPPSARPDGVSSTGAAIRHSRPFDERDVQRS